MAASFSEHTRVMEALLRGDADAAADRLRQHILVQGERFADLLAALARLRANPAALLPGETCAGLGRRNLTARPHY